MRVPILKQGDFVIASIQPMPGDEDFEHLRQNLTACVGQYRSKGVGIQPDVAFTMVQLGLDPGDVATTLDLEEALAVLPGETHQS